MVRGGKTEEISAEKGERNRLKRLAFANNILSENPSKASSSSSLSPSKTVIKHHGKDILRKSQRGKNRFLFSFPGLLAPVSGGKIGELKDLGTKNPILYLDFPQGRMKLFGTIVYPKNRYLTLQFSRGGKNVTCEDNFDAMVVFSDAWWIGNKDDNPEEFQLEFPMDLNIDQQTEYDFKGGAGAKSEIKEGVERLKMRFTEQQSPKHELDDDISDSQNNLKDLAENTPTRHSTRNTGKTFNFTEVSSGDDSAENEAVMSDEKEKKLDSENLAKTYTAGKIDNSHPTALDIDNEGRRPRRQILKQFEEASTLERKSKELSSTNRGSLVQTSISTLFKQVEEKKATKNQRKSPSLKVSEQALQPMNSRRKNDQAKAKESKKKKRQTDEGTKGRKSKARKKHQKVEDVDIEELTSTSPGTNGSDEDWAA